MCNSKNRVGLFERTRRCAQRVLKAVDVSKRVDHKIGGGVDGQVGTYLSSDEQLGG